ncbi:unnamed protein product [Amoebophrya sp. A120]|nr:unnamed protein product [Amoebophrya sp. A120]|eukprot:GSA120T00001733001.1
MLKQWIPHPVEGYVMAKDTGQTKDMKGKKVRGYQIENASQEVVWLTAEEITKVADVEDDHLMGLPDVCQLRSVVNAAVLQSLETRYGKGEIYTMIDQIIVSCNPFERLGLDTPEVMDKYINAADSREQPPHVYSIAKTALSGCVRESLNQAILISGESGAGKTEACKIMLGFFADSAGHNESRIQDRIMQCNPILEAFGNAKTSRNNNSSRFGKWTAIMFGQKGSIDGALLVDYLLEKSRVLKQTSLERNFHIFYMLLHGPDGAKYGLPKGTKWSDFNYLKSGAQLADGVDDKTEYNEVVSAFEDVTIGEKKRADLFKAVAGILLLGNVSFQAGKNDSSICDKTKEVSTAWECDDKVLQTAITNKKLIVGKDVTVKQLKPELANEARNGLATLVYSRLFAWLMENLNKVVAGDIGNSSAKKIEVGLLDIAGFESFPNNTWEQITINLSNENLQQHFNEFVFKREMADYKAEGVSVEGITFADNQEILDTIAAPRDSIFSVLDDATKGMRQTDKTFMNNLGKLMETKKNAYFEADKFNKDPPEFTLTHYAGKVTYNVGGWVHEKNTDDPPPEAMDVLKTSKNELLRDLGKQLEEEGKQKKLTVSTQFRASLKTLMERIRSAVPHFVRCIKPNDEKKPKIFTRAKVLEQLIFSGAMEAVKIRQQGYPLRALPAEFCRKYRACFPVKLRMECEKKAGKKLPDPAVVTLILDRLPEVFHQPELKGQYVMGKTKVMARLRGHQVLDEQVRFATLEKTIKIQAAFRGYRTRKMTKRARELRGMTQNWMKTTGSKLYKPNTPNTNALATFKNDLGKLKAECDQVKKWRAEIESMSTKLKVCEAAFLTCQTKLHKEYEVYKDMNALLKTVDLDQLQTAVSQLTNLAIEDEVAKRLAVRLDMLSVQLPLITAMAGLSDRTDPSPSDLDACKRLQHVVEQATQKGLKNQSDWLDEQAGAKFVKLQAQWERLKSKLDEEKLEKHELKHDSPKELVKLLTAAINNCDKRGIQASLSTCVANGQVDANDLKPAREMLTKLMDPGWIEEQLHSCLKTLEAKKDFHGLATKVANLALAGQDAGVDADLLTKAENASRIAHIRRGSLFQRDGKVASGNLDMVMALYGDMSKAPCINTDVVKPITGPDGNKILPCEPGGTFAWSKNKLSAPLTNIGDASMNSTATAAYRNVLGWMTDHPVDEKRRVPLLYAIVWKARSEAALTNEMYAQVIKQLTHNPGLRSQLLGWKLLAFIFQHAIPTPDFIEYVRAFLVKSKQKFEKELPEKKELLTMATQCMDTMAKTAPPPAAGEKAAAEAAAATGANSNNEVAARLSR